MYKGEKESSNIAINFVRMSVGLEDIEDLISDLSNSLDEISKISL